MYLATEEPVHQYDPREPSTWVRTPTTSTSGFMFNQTAMDPACSTPGTNLYVMGAVFPGEKGRDQRFLRDTFLAGQVREYAAAGLRHLVMWNITAFGDPALARYSFGAMKELRTELSR